MNKKLSIGDKVKIHSGEYEGQYGIVVYIGTNGGVEVYVVCADGNNRFCYLWDFQLEKVKNADEITQEVKEEQSESKEENMEQSFTNTEKGESVEVTGYAKNVEELIYRQYEKGLKKYGVTLDQNTTLTTEQRIEHLEEEMIDGLMYCEHLKSSIKGNGITADDYQRAALRTAQSDTMSRDELLLNGVMGLCGEAGECIDLVKKTRFQGHGMDYDALKKELGDVAWYLAVASYGAGFDLSDVFQSNIEKLKERYPDGFDKARSIHRAEYKTEGKDNGSGTT